VVRQPCLRGRFRTRSPTTIAPTIRSGGRKPPVVSQTRLQRRSPNTRETADAAPENLIAIAAARITARLLRFAFLLACASSSHGGLTPAALVNMRSPIAKIAFLPADARTATRSGGRKPPVDYENALATTIPQYAGDCRRRTREPHCNRSSQNHCALIAVCDSPYMSVVEPRRAHARRS
jgi:hypothetical protein